MGTKQSIDQLNSFLRGELSAVETYRMAIEKLDASSPAIGELEACLSSHAERVQLLRDAILLAGGTPSDGSGPWGVFAKVVEGGARMFGDRAAIAAIAALEEGEDHGIGDYQDDVDDLDVESRQLVTDRLMPLQQQTHDRMSALKRRLAVAKDRA